MRIYTDASTNTKKGISAIACVITDEKGRLILKIKTVIDEADNNTAELRAVLFALKNARSLGNQKFKHVTVLTDSQYAIRAIRKGTERPYEKRIVTMIDYCMKLVNSDLFWIKANHRLEEKRKDHIGKYNEMVDKLASETRKAYEASLKVKNRPSFQNGYNNYSSRNGR